MEHGTHAHADPDERWLAVTVHVAFFLLLGSSFVRFLTRDQGGPPTEWVVALFAVFCLLYVLGGLLAPAPRAGVAPTARHLVWLGSVTAVWVALLVLAPSATWCAMPLLFAGLHALPPRIAVPVAAVLTVLVVVSEIRVADGALNPNMVVAPPAVAAVATAVLVHLQRQGVRQRVLIQDLVRTRHDLAVAERRAGVLAERQRLATEIHDTLAQGLSSQRMLLQAAERVWGTDPHAARAHLGEAAEITSRNLVEARRFVHDLAPADLTDQSLPDALTVLARRESGPGLTVEFRLDGEPDPGRLPERVEAALLRIAQGALANIREHAAATRAAVTLTFLDDQVSLDVADNGRGFDVGEGGFPQAAAESVGGPPGRRPAGRHPEGTRGHGLPAMRIRARQLGGAFAVESAPGEGTVVSVAVPLAPLAPSVSAEEAVL
ncbi:sensor histidine kinase [Streptomyces lincolnensis]|uniref:sensor histidine kinase n=1 Tax=Streptomyces lincolnensis TaxID=1915 RepID=UPI001E552A72|nr:sensor histidine kinase [Streptomyces lincolnensis]MCD7440933.1 sensor histidine kinase [Streptomyces lincolnensis]